MARKATGITSDSTASPGFTAKLWLAAAKLRNLMQFCASKWFRQEESVRRQFGVPTKGNAKFALSQFVIHRVAPASLRGGTCPTSF